MGANAKICGECSLCCHVYPIPEIGKAGHRWCAHHMPGAGCAIHADRPQTCRAFDCIWLQDATLGPEWKPSVSKLVLALVTAGDALLLKITVHPGWPEAWRRQPYLADIRRWAAELPPTRRAVLVYTGAHRVLVLPGREIVLDGDAGGLRFTQGPAGWDAEVVAEAA